MKYECELCELPRLEVMDGYVYVVGRRAVEEQNGKDGFSHHKTDSQ